MTDYRGAIDAMDEMVERRERGYVCAVAVHALTLGLDANYVTNEVTADADSLSLQGVGVYARYQVNAPVGLGVRWERLDDEGLFGGIDQVLQEITLTAEYKLADGFLVRGEFRRDWSDQSYFPGSGGAEDLRDGTRNSF